jgi:hypothetical protein
MAARLRFGSRPDFLISVGGFNGRYTPAADLDVPDLQRVTFDMLPTSDNPRLRTQSYFAVTSNTLQHGARIELYAAAAGFGLKGFLAYDLLAQLSPLHFEADFAGAIAILAGGEEVLSLGLSLHLSGPSAWHVDGEVSFKILFVRIRIGVHATFGDEAQPALPEFDVAALLRDQIKAPRNWVAHVPDQSQLMVALKRRERPRRPSVRPPRHRGRRERQSSARRHRQAAVRVRAWTVLSPDPRPESQRPGVRAEKQRDSRRHRGSGRPRPGASPGV